MPSPLSGPLFKHSPDGTVQLPMFGTASEIISHYKPADLQAYQGNVEHMLADKQEEADSRPGVGYDVPDDFAKTPKADRASGWYGGLTERIKKNGYDWSKPVDVWGMGKLITDGHHRLAVMHRDRPEEFIPIKYDNDEVGQRTHLQNKYDDVAESLGPDLANIAFKPNEYPYVKRQANKGPVEETKN
jgi:hypothetical protein